MHFFLTFIFSVFQWLLIFQVNVHVKEYLYFPNKGKSEFPVKYGIQKLLKVFPPITGTWTCFYTVAVYIHDRRRTLLFSLSDCICRHNSTDTTGNRWMRFAVTNAALMRVIPSKHPFYLKCKHDRRNCFELPLGCHYYVGLALTSVLE